MTDHTPEPWLATAVKDKHSDLGPAFWLIDAVPQPNQETAVAELCAKPGDRSEANAKRIVACVNACAGIPTEQLKAGSVRGLLDAIDKKLVTEERGYLEDALAPFQKD